MRLRLQQVAAAGIDAYWAVAEQQAATSDYWRDFNALWTGDGTLGERLHQVYSHLRHRSKRVILIGADCPQLSAATIINAAATSNTIIGPATDGGFYLFAASCTISKQQWTAPQYSSAETRAMLIDALHDPAICQLPPLTDIDDTASLQQCISEFNDSSEAAILKQYLIDAT